MNIRKAAVADTKSWLQNLCALCRSYVLLLLKTEIQLTEEFAQTGSLKRLRHYPYLIAEE